MKEKNMRNERKAQSKNGFKYILIFCFITIITGGFVISRKTPNLFLANYGSMLSSVTSIKKELQSFTSFLANQMNVGGRNSIKNTISTIRENRSKLFTQVETLYGKVKKLSGETQEKHALLNNIDHINNAISYIDIGIISIDKIEELDPIQLFYDALFKANSSLNQIKINPYKLSNKILSKS